ncbi:MAG: oxidoreductase [Candidatus Bathyarchaeota archaeon]|nr:oxidoreductase [Candidatus Bathyarchaeota archaeon]MCX8177626.1 oxidoreductase [Candidatus Bathyarchaeota archaeon]MDW8193883.1 oxidoreductase [Nitrososphaerota archaeon]
MSKEKLKIAFYWAASCGGCEIAVLDINEKILDVVQIADIVFWPVAMDVKYKDVENMPDKHIDICFFNGGIRNSEQEYMAKLLRQKSKVLVAYGACAHLGGVPGLANLSSKKEIFEKVYLSTPSTVNSEGVVPQPKTKVGEGELEIPEFYDTVRTLDQTVDVDYYVPGCPPAVERTLYAIEALTKDSPPPKGTVLAPPKSVCDECPRKKESKKVSNVYRVYEKIPEPEKCLLEQGFICMGPATRGGCGARCLKANMPCTGCGGPCPNSPEQGAAMISALASILGLEEEKEMYTEEKVEKLVDQIKDPIGTFYMYALPASILRRRVIRQ